LRDGLEVPRSEKLLTALMGGIQAVRPRVVIESGTYMGTGSTRVIIEALGTLRPEAFYTIEVSAFLVKLARLNLAAFPWVQVIWGLSTTRKEAVSFIESDPLLCSPDPGLDIVVDFLPDPRSGYVNEILTAIGSGGAPEGVLLPLLLRHRNDRPLISLDSAQGMGWLEFQLVSDTLKGQPYLLLLDDINQLKHYRSRLTIETSADFVVYDSDIEDGWMVAEHRPGGAIRGGSSGPDVGYPIA
jgi:hypothetical protein